MKPESYLPLDDVKAEIPGTFLNASSYQQDLDEDIPYDPLVFEGFKMNALITRKMLIMTPKWLSDRKEKMMMKKKAR